MNWVDGLIVLFLLSAIVRGIEQGFVRQLGSAGGFLLGLFAGAWLEGKLVHLAHTATSRTVLSLGVTLGVALVFLVIGDFLASLAKSRLEMSRINSVDRTLGSVIAMAAVLVTVWLGASIFGNSQLTGWQRAVQQSSLIKLLNRELPPAPKVIAKLGHLISPNGFPQVFIGLEPNPSQSSVNIPDMGELTPAVKKDAASVVKIEGAGCGGVVEGSGFVAADGIVVTNAHVIAGVQHPQVIDANGVHNTTVINFDPNLDFAVLRVLNLAGAPLKIDTNTVESGTAGAVLGYPGGGDFTAKAAAVIDSYTANGRNIYNEDSVARQIYSVRADVIPGNSGGPLIDKDGDVIGIVFAESLTYQHVGYALTTQHAVEELHQAQNNIEPVGTGSCAE